MPVLVHECKGLASVSGAVLVALFTALPEVAGAVAKTPTITGNSWVALVIIGVLVATIFMLIRGALHVERRDAAMGRGHGRNNGWYGIFPAQRPDEDDAPDYHHFHGDGGDGGGGEGGG